eukprot:4763034-Amphidinium_carterae.1
MARVAAWAKAKHSFMYRTTFCVRRWKHEIAVAIQRRGVVQWHLLSGLRWDKPWEEDGEEYLDSGDGPALGMRRRKWNPWNHSLGSQLPTLEHCVHVWVFALPFCLRQSTQGSLGCGMGCLLSLSLAVLVPFGGRTSLSLWFCCMSNLCVCSFLRFTRSLLGFRSLVSSAAAYFHPLEPVGCHLMGGR